MSSLSTLPRELRDLIYHQLWRLTPYLRFQTPFRLLYRPRDHNRLCKFWRPTRRRCTCPTTIHHPGLPLWLLTSKSILSEGLDQLFRHAVWQWSASDHAPPPPEYLQATPNPLAGLSRATDLCIADSHHEHRHNGRRIDLYVTIDYSKHRLREFDHLLPPALKTLRLDLSIEALPTFPVSLDLSELVPKGFCVEHIKIKFKLSLATRRKGAYKAWYSPFIRDAKAEVARVGRMWLCESEETSLEMTMETQWLKDEGMPPEGSEPKYQWSSTRFQVARKGMLGKVRKSAEHMIL